MFTIFKLFFCCPEEGFYRDTVVYDYRIFCFLIFYPDTNDQYQWFPKEYFKLKVNSSTKQNAVKPEVKQRRKGKKITKRQGHYPKVLILDEQDGRVITKKLFKKIGYPDVQSQEMHELIQIIMGYPEDDILSLDVGNTLRSHSSLDTRGIKEEKKHGIHIYEVRKIFKQYITNTQDTRSQRILV